MASQAYHIVIGGDGFLGRNIVEDLRKSGRSAIATSRRKQSLSDSCVYLDLAEDVSSWEIPEGVDAAFFCAAVTLIEQCQNHPEESRIVNMGNVVKLADRFVRKGISVVFPSTNLVFDGRIPNRRINDPVCPSCQYGRQKAAAEIGFMGLGRSISIVRFSKILGSETHLIKDWMDKLGNGICIHPFSDMVLAPVPIDFAVKVMIGIVDSGSFGIWHVSAKEEITYEEFARHIARKIGVDQLYVQPISVHDLGFEFESVPEHTILDTSRIENELNLSPPDVWKAIDSLFRF